MMRSTRSEIAALVLVMGAGVARGDDTTKKLSPHAQITSSVSATTAEAGVEGAWDNILHDIPDEPALGVPSYRAEQARLFVRAPMGAGGATNTISLARLGVRGTHSWGPMARLDDTDGWCAHRLSLQAEYAVARYQWFVNGVEAARRRAWEQSFAIEAEYRRVLLYKSGHQYVPQVRVRYDRSWHAGATLDVVVPGTPPAPSITKPMIIDAPVVAPELSARVAMPFSFGGQLGFGPALRYTWTGAAGDFTPGTRVQRARFEGFVYWFSTGDKGGRVGVAPFVDVRVTGTDDRKRVDVGGLIDLRVGSNLLEY